MAAEAKKSSLEIAPLGDMIIKKETSNDVDAETYLLKLLWPEWLPSDWSMHRDNDTSAVLYSNAKGKKFYSKEEVVQYLATEQAQKKVTSRRTRRKIPKANGNIEEKKVAQHLLDSPPEWPEWLPKSCDWCIVRSCDDPTEVFYCNTVSSKWKRFKCKEEVLKYIAIQSKKVIPKQSRKRKNLSKAKDELFTNNDKIRMNHTSGLINRNFWKQEY